MSHERMPLGQSTSYTDQYDPQLLFPLSRAETRAGLGLNNGWPWFGGDVWQAYELS
ncbi:MAG: NADPH-dependent 7-cyano-7-deazaguanine reductase QueF, partial [Halomonadaceae bacterium]